MNEQLSLFDDSSPIVGDRLCRLRLLLNDLEKFSVDICEALKYSGDSHTLDDLMDGIIVGKYHFYPLEKSFVIAEIISYPQQRVYNVFLAGGDLQELKHFARTALVDNARQLGCSKLSLAGRHGWVRALQHDGWKHTLSVVERGL